MFAKHTFIQLKSINACSALQNEPKCGNPCGEITQRMKGVRLRNWVEESWWWGLMEEGKKEFK